MRARVWNSVLAVVVLASTGCGGDDSDGSDGSNDNDTNDSMCTGPACDGATCVEAWQCTSWESDGTSNTGTRSCMDLSGCGTTESKPVETAQLPALDANFYECNVEPVLTQDCSMLGCHGKETGRAYRIYARGRLRVTGGTLTEPGCSTPGQTFPSEQCTGSIECRCFTVPQLTTERRRSFDSARGFGLDPSGAMLTDLTQSELLRQPQAGGGFAHAGISMWTTSDTDYQTVKSWLEGATRPTACNSMN